MVSAPAFWVMRMPPAEVTPPVPPAPRRRMPALRSSLRARASLNFRVLLSVTLEPRVMSPVDPPPLTPVISTLFAAADTMEGLAPVRIV